VYDQMNEYHCVHARVVHCKLSVDEHFYDCGHDVFLYVESMLNFAEAKLKVYSLTESYCWLPSNTVY